MAFFGLYCDKDTAQWEDGLGIAFYGRMHQTGFQLIIGDKQYNENVKTLQRSVYLIC